MLGWIKRRSLLAAVLAVPLAMGAMPTVAQAETTLRVIPHADLKNLDPIWTTAYITRNHGYMIYDTLFAMDEDFKPQPQMVDTWSTSDDGLVWTFVLRDGLKFHDGAPVTATDVVASLERWGKRDGMGQQLMANTASLEAQDDKTVVLTLANEYGLVLESIGKISSNVPFIMPARVAATDPFEQITDFTGSGPFVFEADQWVPGSKVVYTKFADYVPREEPVSAASGGKIAKVDKVEWTYFPDQTTAMNALMAGEIDFFEAPANDLAPLLDANPDITVEVNDPLGNVGFARFNHLLPPFDNAEVRRAALMAMKQEDYMAGAVGDPAFWKTCHSVFPCGTPLDNDVGSDVMSTGDIDKAKEALAASGYDGTPVVIMQPTDIPILSAFSLITAEKLRDTGFEVEVQAMDWSTLTSRRALRDPVADGGWNMFHTWWIGADVIDPMAIAFSGNPEAGWFGWAEDAELETARTAFAVAGSADEKAEIGAKVQERLWAIGASGHLGQFFTPVAYRNNVKGLIKSPVQFFWNIGLE
ncbi:ABC transporter substrate-binding protein [uncultured Sulfitobacter sp.]|uniref:ABC transporter substrate-binding protein n=1 Tax=uncultured Sulfitobacter sp. TaxID=191468 RepID=UPI002639B6CE|nr:ABC transporter substrate-binding protein [uncultured Sulfitobacter sp.]